MNEKSSRPLIGTFLVMLFVLEGIFIGGIFLFLNTQPWIAGAFISIGAPIMVVLVVTLALHLLWNRLTAPFPPQEVPHTADQRSFQSFSWGFVNMGLSINAAIDDEYLHLEPILIWRVLGAHSTSIPFTAMVRTERGRGVRIAGRTLMGPTWCFTKVADHNV